MTKKIWSCLLIFTLVTVLGVGAYTLTYADETSDKQQELDDINEQKSEVKSDLESLAASIESQEAEIEGLIAAIDQKQAEIDQAQADIERTIQEIREQQDGLNQRLRTMYKNGSVGYLDVLLGSNSLSEFLTNLEMIQRIYRGDQEMLRTLKRQRQELEEKQEQLAAEQESLAEQKAEAEERKEALKADQEELRDQLDVLNQQAEQISGEIAAMQSPDRVYGGGPFIWPTTSTYLTSYFGYREHPVYGIEMGHTGIDIGVGTGSPVYAAADGTVIVSSEYGGYGNAVVIDHGSGLSTLYGHNSVLNVSVGQQVKQGQVIAYSGNTGITTGPHLHFEVRVGGTPVDPMSYF